ncbi:hypothetical protein [Streptomyces sp. NPDC088794]|uniref:hypothetical protein n=1 Tax=Streptomyces sp. NPDC088794 TaxID=3365902 RepID=UPI00381A3EE5
MSHDRNGVSASPLGLRLLPWETESGKPCFLSTDGTHGVLSRLADEIETSQLRDGAQVFAGARTVLDDRKAGEYALRRALRATTEVLGNVLRVAESRGARLPQPDGDDGAGDENKGEGVAKRGGDYR